MDDLEAPYGEAYLDYMRRWSKCYLQRIRSCVHTIEQIRSEIAELDESMVALRAYDPAGDRVAGVAGDDATVNRIARYEELRAEFSLELDSNLQAQADAHRALRHVRQPWRMILTYRSLETLKWKQIAKQTGFSEDYCKHSLHDNGLVELFPFIPHEYDGFPAAS